MIKNTEYWEPIGNPSQKATARARGKRTTWLLLWDIIFEIDRCQQALSESMQPRPQGLLHFSKWREFNGGRVAAGE